MAKKKASKQKAAVSETQATHLIGEIRRLATSNLSFLIYDILEMEDASNTTIDAIDNIVLTCSSRFNYYERLMLHNILRVSSDLRFSATPDKSVLSDNTCYTSLSYQMQWMLNLVDSQNEADFTWSDNVNRLLRSLHRATLTAGSFGPVWFSSAPQLVESDDEFELGMLKELVEQLMKDGLISRGKGGLFKAMEKARWPALEEETLDVDDDSEEDEDEEMEEVRGFEEREENAAKAVDQARFTLRAHKEAERLRGHNNKCNLDLEMEEEEEEDEEDEEDDEDCDEDVDVQKAKEAYKVANAAGDVYAAIAADEAIKMARRARKNAGVFCPPSTQDPTTSPLGIYWPELGEAPAPAPAPAPQEKLKKPLPPTADSGWKWQEPPPNWLTNMSFGDLSTSCTTVLQVMENSLLGDISVAEVSNIYTMESLTNEVCANRAKLEGIIINSHLFRTRIHRGKIFDFRHTIINSPHLNLYLKLKLPQIYSTLSNNLHYSGRAQSMKNIKPVYLEAVSYRNFMNCWLDFLLPDDLGERWDLTHYRKQRPLRIASARLLGESCSLIIRLLATTMTGRSCHFNDLLRSLLYDESIRDLLTENDLESNEENVTKLMRITLSRLVADQLVASDLMRKKGQWWKLADGIGPWELKFDDFIASHLRQQRDAHHTHRQSTQQFLRGSHVR